MSPRINHTPPLAQLDVSQTIEGAPRVEFTFPLPTKTPTPQQFADAALAALGFTDGDVQAYDAHSGGSLRQRLAAGFVEQGGATTSVVTDEKHRHGAGRFHLSRQNYEGLQRFLAERRQARSAPPPAPTSSPSETFSVVHGYNIAEQQRAALEARLAEQHRRAPRPSEPPPPAADSRREGSQEGVGAFLDGVVRGDFSTNESWSATAGQIIGGLNPLADARDIAAGIYHVAQGKEDAWFELGTAAAGAIPLGGDAAKALLRSGRKVVTELGEEVAERAVREGAGETAERSVREGAEEATEAGSKRAADEAAAAAYRSTTEVRQNFREMFGEARYNEYAREVERAKMARPELRDIPTEDLVAIRGYTSDDYTFLNSALRNNDAAALSRLDPYIRCATSGLNQLPAHKGFVFRGTSLTPAQAAQYVPGTVRIEPSFFSTAAEAKAAFPGDTEFVIRSASGKDISILSEAPREKEILFPPGTQFDVLSVDVDPKTGIRTIYMNEVTRGGQE